MPCYNLFYVIYLIGNITYQRQTLDCLFSK